MKSQSQAIAVQSTQSSYQNGYNDGLKLRPNYKQRTTDANYSQGYTDGAAIYYEEAEQKAKPKRAEMPGERYAAGLTAGQMGERPHWTDTEYLAGWVAGVALNADGSVKYGSGYTASCPSDRTRQEWNHEA
jgi:hypothetical protein